MFSRFLLFCLTTIFVTQANESSGQVAEQKKLFSEYKFKRLGGDDGLKSNVITDIAQDQLGFIWVASENGVYRYLEGRFERFSKDQNSLSNNYISNLQIDEDNQVWMMTESGVSRYSYDQDAIIHYKPDKLTGQITAMAVDDEGNKYFAKYHGGIYRLNKRDELDLLDLTFAGKQLNDFSVRFLAKSKNELWAVLGDEGLVRINLDNMQTHFLDPTFFGREGSLVVFDLYIDKSNNIWVLSENEVFKITEDTQGDFQVESLLRNEPIQDDFLDVFEDEQGKIWLGTRKNGLLCYVQEANGSLTQTARFDSGKGEKGPSYRTINKIFQDDNDLFWLGTHNGGINVFRPEGEKIRLVSSEDEGVGSLSFQNVWGISESSSGLLWVGTDGKGINLLDPVTKEVQRPEWAELEDVAVLTLLEDSRHRLWVGTYKNGLFKVDLKTNQITNYRVGSRGSALRVNDVRAIYESENGEIYVGTNLGGTYQFNETTRRLEALPLSGNYDVRAIVMTNDGLLWMGTYRSGLLSYNPQNHSLAQYVVDKNPDNFVSIFDLHHHEKILWLGTRERGLVGFDLNQKGFIEQVPPELSRLSISSVHGDEQQILWIASSEGIFAYDMDKNKVLTFDDSYGFQKAHFNFGSMLLVNQEFIAVGGVQGLNLFYPQDLMAQSKSESILLSTVIVGNRKVNPLNSGIFPENESIFLTDEIRLDHTDNVFSLGISLPGFSETKLNEFTYKLEGFEKEWHTSGVSNQVTYRNVSPGTYTFKVFNTFKPGITKEVTIEIIPPIWKTWYAYALLGLLISLALWLLLRFNNARLVLKKNLEFQQSLREQEQASMQEKLRFYTNFSHELKTPLTLIQGPVNDLIKREKDPEALQYLNLIRKNTSVLLKFIRRMLEFRKLEMNKTVLNVGRYDLYILAQEEAESFSYMSKERGIVLGFYSEPELYAWVDIEKIQIILNNLLSNAIKFSEKGNTVKFGMFHDGDEVVIEVKDQGTGIAKSELPNIFTPFYQASNSAGSGGTGIGLALCKNFVDLHKGQIKVESKKGKGTVFEVRFKKDKVHLEGLEHVRFVDVRSEMSASNGELPIATTDHHEEVSDTDKILLVVDDNEDISTYINSLFKSEFKIIACKDADTGLKAALDYTPDIIISDVMMPGTNGFEFCEHIKSNTTTSHIPFILLTAKNSSQSQRKGLETGADDYITKPFSSELLYARVNNLLSNRRLIELRYTSKDLINNDSQVSSREAEFVLKVESTIYGLMEKSAFSVPDLCRELGMSQTSLYRKIKTLTGDSIQLFIRKIKIKKAAEMLVSEDMTVAEICFSLDFSDLKHFRKCFKQQYGMTPSQYKHKATASMIS